MTNFFNFEKKRFFEHCILKYLPV